MDCLRISQDVLINEARLSDLLKTLKSSQGLVKELSFFTSQFHCPIAIEDIQDVSGRMRKVFPSLREMGYGVGINHLATLGHHEENLEIAVDSNLPRQVGFDGQSCRGALCPTSPAVHEYVKETYEILTSVSPDFIWVDDDIRLAAHFPTSCCCMCEYCVEQFSTQMAEQFTRESLVAAMEDADFERRRLVRTKFLQQNSEIIKKLLELIEKTVHSINSDVQLGFMTGDRFWEGYDFGGWAQALRGQSSNPVRWRPGGGFYADNVPGELLEKAHAIGRQVAGLPEYVSIIMSEIENFPYQPLRKARQANVLETTAYLFAGCTGTAFNILGQELAEHKPLVEHLAGHIQFWNRLKEELRGTRLVGIWPSWDSMQIAAGQSGIFTRQGDRMFADICQDMDYGYNLAELGLGVCYQQGAECMAVLAGRMPHAMGRERMRDLLSRGVLLDAEAVLSLQEMGLGDMTGVEVGKSFDLDSCEVFTDHSLNGSYAGAVRDCRQSFRWWHCAAYELRPLSDGTEVIARLVDYQGRDRGASVTTFTNELGGRVAVMSYYPWTYNMGSAKRRQIIRLSDWLSRETLPVIIHSMARIVPWARQHSDGRLIVGLLNLGADIYTDVKLTLRCSEGKVVRLTTKGQTESVQHARREKGVEVSLDRIDPYSFEVVICSDNC